MANMGIPLLFSQSYIRGEIDLMNVAVLDLETNGMTGSSVLSASSLVFNAEGTIFGVFNRFYVSHEPPDFYATRIHGLTPERIAALRSTLETSPYFLEEWPDLLEFWENRDVAGVVVHNLTYDTAFLPEIAQSAFRWWCSMRGLTAWCAIPKRPGNFRNGEREYKWPRLQETADRICNDPEALEPPPETARIENAMEDFHAHVSLCDCFELYRIVVRVLRHRPELIAFAPHVVPFRPPRKKGGASGAFPRHDRFTAEVLAYEKKLRSLTETFAKQE